MAGRVSKTLPTLGAWVTPEPWRKKLGTVTSGRSPGLKRLCGELQASERPPAPKNDIEADPRSPDRYTQAGSQTHSSKKSRG